jgi:hypothetical protein
MKISGVRVFSRLRHLRGRSIAVFLVLLSWTGCRNLKDEAAIPEHVGPFQGSLLLASAGRILQEGTCERRPIVRQAKCAIQFLFVDHGRFS